MKVVYCITPPLREKLKEPFDMLIEGTFDQTISKLKEIVAANVPPMLISVGDVVSKNLHKHKLHPQLTVIDYISQRNKIATPTHMHGEETVRVKNPQGTITEEAITAIQEAIASCRHTHIIVEGEEDLLTLIALLYAPDNALVIYGQPRCGIVVVRVTAEKKAQAQQFLKAMKPAKS
jgi:GTP-dependent dephospho-CoA kinase